MLLSLVLALYFGEHFVPHGPGSFLWGNILFPYPQHAIILLLPYRSRYTSGNILFPTAPAVFYGRTFCSPRTRLIVRLCVYMSEIADWSQVLTKYSGKKFLIRDTALVFDPLTSRFRALRSNHVSYTLMKNHHILNIYTHK
jgi:hypothetical protein